MVSLDGDSQHNLYVDPQGAYGSDQQWVGDVGLGYRWIKNDAAILGWYLFAGHTRVENSSGFWIVSPGVEALGRRWDARINAYIPVAGRSNEIGLEEFNIVNTTVFTGHTATINSAFINENAIQQVGNGADARVGYQFFHQVPLKGYVGAYFFAIPNTNNITGGAAGLEYWFDDNIRVFTNYSYDNYQHSNVVGGLGISFGGVRKHWADPSLSERLTDPVDRYLANLGHGSRIPSKTLLYGMGSGSSSVLISDSIAFFSQTGTPNNGGAALNINNCTFEDPCGPTDFSQTGVNTLNTLLPNTDFYFNGGTYPANNGVATPLMLNDGQSVFSRTADYSVAATGAARSTFNGGFDLIGNNQIESVILTDSSGFITFAINADNAQNIVINNSQLGTAGSPYNSGLGLGNSSAAILNNSTIFFNGTAGIQAIDSSILMESSDINGMGSNPVTQGITLNNANARINNSQITVTGSLANTGIRASFDSTAEINNTNIIVGTNSNPDTQIGLSNNTGDSEIVMNGGTIAVNGSSATQIHNGAATFNGLVTCTINGTTVDCATS